MAQKAPFTRGLDISTTILESQALLLTEHILCAIPQKQNISLLVLTNSDDFNVVRYYTPNCKVLHV